MKKNIFYTLTAFLLVNCVNSQIVYKDVASIFYARCTSCHHSGGISFPMTNYMQTAGMASSIQADLISGKMPPWNADTTYTRFQHERIISYTEKQSILNWISSGAQKGDLSQVPPPPIYNNVYELQGNADLTLSIGTFPSTSTTSDKYYCFSMPSGLTQDRILRAFEIVPGNRAIVHHVVLTADTTGNYASDLSGNCYNIPGNLGIGTYAPGTKATVFPSQEPLKAGIYIKAGSNIIIQLHYPAGTSGLIDSTKVRLFFYPVGTTGVRRIYSETPLQNWSMFIPPNTIKSYDAYFPSANTNLQTSISAFAVMPHSHLICKSILYYAIKPGIDTIPLVRINNWNFEWQDYFTFKKLVKIPNGYRLYSKHIYDNTVNNPNNPNTPPKLVISNTGTKDEMLFDGMMYMSYQIGDELIDIESIINSDSLLANSSVGLKENKVDINKMHSMVYPNPFNNSVNFRYIINKASNVSIEITDIVGRKINSYDLGKQAEGEHVWQWDGKDANAEVISLGVYFYKLKASNSHSAGKIIKQE